MSDRLEQALDKLEAEVRRLPLTLVIGREGAIKVDAAVLRPNDYTRIAALLRTKLIERWECPPPAPGFGYVVVDEEFDTDAVPPVRVIKQIRLIG